MLKDIDRSILLSLLLIEKDLNVDKYEDTAKSESPKIITIK